MLPSSESLLADGGRRAFQRQPTLARPERRSRRSVEVKFDSLSQRTIAVAMEKRGSRRSASECSKSNSRPDPGASPLRPRLLMRLIIAVMRSVGRPETKVASAPQRLWLIGIATSSEGFCRIPVAVRALPIAEAFGTKTAIIRSSSLVPCADSLLRQRSTSLS